MAFTNHSWLKGDAERDRGHELCKVTLKISESTWSSNKEVKLAFLLTRDDGDYRVLRLTEEDIKILLPHLLAELSDSKIMACMRQAIALQQKT